MASSSANVEGSSTAGVQVMEWLLDGAVPVIGVFSLRPGALSCGALMMVAAGVSKFCGAAVVGGEVTSTSNTMLFEVLLTMLGTGGGPC
jgi:hypothetical protein